MEQVLNFPYEKDLTPNTIAQILCKKYPKGQVKEWHNYVFLQKNFFTVVRFSVREWRGSRQVFFKTKMNLWLLLSIIVMLVFGFCYFISEMNHLRNDDYIVLSIAFLTPLVLWLAYLIFKVGTVGQVKRLLECEIPNYLVNRTEYFFPPQSVMKKWQKDMQAVPWLILSWFIARILFFIATHFSWQIYQLSGIEINPWKYVGYADALGSLILMAVAVIFVTKKYNSYWNVAKILFLIYTAVHFLFAMFTIFQVWNHLGNSFTIIISVVGWCLLTSFACFFYSSLRNTSSLYFIKTSVIWCVLSVILFSYYQYITHNDFSFDSIEYRRYDLGATISTIIYLIGFFKSFFTMPIHVPQGIDIKIL